MPHIGWNGTTAVEISDLTSDSDHYYFVHSFGAIIREDEVENDMVKEWAHTLTTYGDESFISSVRRGT